jgi:murein DD-endopeptidase MepM/ murein hydrolase activator NlpD
MAEYVDRVVTELIADTSNYDVKIATSERTFQRAMQSTERAASQTEQSASRALTTIASNAARTAMEADRSTRQMRAGFQQLSFQLGDIAQQLALGVPYGTIFAQQSGQVVQAIQVMGGEANAFTRFMVGPWGIALASAAVVIGPLIAKLFDTRSELEKATDQLEENARKTDLARAAQEAFAHTLPGIEQAIRSETEALEQQNRSLAQNQELALQRARRHAADLDNLLTKNLRDQAQAYRDLQDAQAAYNRARTSPVEGEAAAAADALRRAEQRVRDLQAENARIHADAARAQAQIRAAQVPIAVRQAEALVDPLAAINQRYDDMKDRAIAAAQANNQLNASLAQTLAQIERRRPADVAAERDRQSAARRGTDADTSTFQLPVQGPRTGGFGETRPGHRHAGVDIAVPVGTNVQAAAAGTIIEAGTLPGYGNVVIIDHGRGTTTRYAHLSQILVQRGQQVGQGTVIGLSGGARGAPGSGDSTGPHVHYEVRRNGRPVNPLTGQYPTDVASGRGGGSEQQLADRRARDEERFQNELAGLNIDLLNARRRAVQTEEESAQSDIDAINAQRDQRNQQFRNEAEDRARRDPVNRAIYEAERDQLIAQNNLVASTRVEQRQALKRQRLDEQRIDIALDELRGAESIEQARGQLARTTAERRESELRLLDLQHQEELLQIQKLRLQQGLNDAQRAALDRQEREANERYGLQRLAVEQRNAGPMASYLSGIPRTAEEINEALERINANALSDFNDGLGEAAARFLHLGGVAGQVLNHRAAGRTRRVRRRRPLREHLWRARRSGEGRSGLGHPGRSRLRGQVRRLQGWGRTSGGGRALRRRRKTSGTVRAGPVGNDPAVRAWIYCRVGGVRRRSATGGQNPGPVHRRFRGPRDRDQRQCRGRGAACRRADDHLRRQDRDDPHPVEARPQSGLTAVSEGNGAA